MDKMTVWKYLNTMKSSLDLDGKYQLYDIINKRGIYCKGYNRLLQELSLNGLDHVQNARFISHEFEDDCNIILYITDIENYSNFELLQVAEKLYNKKEVI